MEPAQRPVVLVTGLSGAGKLSVLRALEDLGFETVDNPPLSIVAELASDGAADCANAPLAIGVDVRSRGFRAAEVITAMQALRARPGLDVSLVFVTAEEAVLVRRFSETRRRHPLAPGGPLGSRVDQGIARESELLAPLRDVADLVIDTSDLPLPDLRRLIDRRFRAPGAAGMAIGVMSFGYPRGLPRDADLVFDVRFLRNPHYDPVLRPLTGRDAPVAAHVEADPDFSAFWDRMTDLLALLLPRYVADGKKYLTVAFGCTGGRHRSVLVAERLSAHLANQGWRIDCIHREVDFTRREAEPGAAPAARDLFVAGQGALSHPS